MKDCTYCEHFRIQEAEPDWSEYTPGSPASIECAKDHWYLDVPWTPKGFRLAVSKGGTCPDFKQTDNL